MLQLGYNPQNGPILIKYAKLMNNFNMFQANYKEILRILRMLLHIH